LRLIAISPAPMRAAHGVTAEKLFFSDPPALPQNSLVMVGSLELESMRGNAADLVASRNEETGKFVEISGASHVSILFRPCRDARLAEMVGAGAALAFYGSVALSPPAPRRAGGPCGDPVHCGAVSAEAAGKNRSEEIATTDAVIGIPRLFLEFGSGSLLIVLVLRIWIL